MQRAVERSLRLQAQPDPEAAVWLFQRRHCDFALSSAPENDALYHELAAQLPGLAWLPGLSPGPEGPQLRLQRGFARIVLQGQVEFDGVGAGQGERRSELKLAFALGAGWVLRLRRAVRQELISGRVRLTHEISIVPGFQRSFRWLIAARLLRWQLNQDIEAASSTLSEADHEQR